jgi:uncharacterized membrane protein YfcA
MSFAAVVLLGLLSALASFYVARWIVLERRRASGESLGRAGGAPLQSAAGAPLQSAGGAPLQSAQGAVPHRPGAIQVITGFVTNFFDTLGVGSFAPTTSVFKLFKLVPDEKIPGTLNSGHALPTVAQALFFIAAVTVDPVTLVGMIAAAVVGAWLGSGIVAKLPRRSIQLGMGVALLIAASLFIMRIFNEGPEDGSATGLTGKLLVVAIAVNFVLGALMTLGIGLYAPCLILVSLLGMNSDAAFPIMMGSCAFLMPVAGLRFIGAGRYDARAAIGLAIGGIPGVLIAAKVVKSLPLDWLRWLVVVVVLYAAITMLRAARSK